MRHVPLLTLLLTVAAPGTARATIMIKLDLPNLVGHAEVVVTGEVVASRSFWTADRRSIETETTVKVTRTIQGLPPGATVTVRTLGGKVGEIRMHVAGSPRLRKGQELLLFLDSRGGHRRVVAMNQGVFDLHLGPGGERRVRQRLGGVALVRKSAAGLKEEHARPISEKLEQFVQQLKQLKKRCDGETGRCRVR